MDEILNADPQLLMFIAFFWGVILAVIIKTVILILNEPFFSGRDWPSNNNDHNNENDL